MDTSLVLANIILACTLIGFTIGSELGETCSSARDCSTVYSYCHETLCKCQPYYVSFNRTCLTSSMLGDECVVNEQCSVRVGNSTCDDKTGTCACKPGTLRFRRHTCLPPATIGNICYNDEHCRLSDVTTYCRYTIPGLIGICRCNSTADATCMPDPADDSPPHMTEETIYDQVDEDREESEEAFLLPGLNSERPQYVLNENPGGNGLHSASLRSALMAKQAEDILLSAVSLGQPCLSSLECRQADPYSVCNMGVCDCANSTTECSAAQTGCHQHTFQCRSSGACISWFFVCDGRSDCPDGSDEDCLGPVCPPMSYQCGNHGKCLSRAVVCDGKTDCPDGEDESDCMPNSRNTTSCPEHAYRCSSGQCVPQYEFCNAMAACDDESDEPVGVCRGQPPYNVNQACPFRCDNARCRSTAIVCSGRDGCGDNSDEDKCHVCQCPLPAT